MGNSDVRDPTYTNAFVRACLCCTHEALHDSVHMIRLALAHCNAPHEAVRQDAAHCAFTKCL